MGYILFSVLGSVHISLHLQTNIVKRWGLIPLVSLNNFDTAKRQASFTSPDLFVEEDKLISTLSIAKNINIKSSTIFARSVLL